MQKSIPGEWRLLMPVVAALFSLSLASPSWAGRCEDLANLKLPDTVIKSAEPVAAGAFSAPFAGKLNDLPAFCRVAASVRAAPDSDIKVEVWLPVDNWTGVFHGVGNGGFGGSLNAGYPGMAAGLRRSYAAATTDMGTAPATAVDGDPLIGHPQKWKDWGRLSTHVMTATGKAITQAFYGQSPKRAYYTGCSTGGQQGLIEALYYPEDYDGILVGAPVVVRTWGHAAGVWAYQAANLEPGHKLSQANLALLHQAVLTTCAGRGSGLATDPFVGDPLACRFDPAVLVCHDAPTDACLTPAEIATVKAFYSGPLSHSGQPLYYGWPLGSEAPGPNGWSFVENTPEPAFDGLFKWVFGPDWAWRTFDLDRDMPKVDAALDASVNGVTRGSTRPFRARGGKLILYQGWADPVVAPAQTLAFYDRLTRESGGISTVRDSARLFMAPGVLHCAGGSGPSAFNAATGSLARGPEVTPRDDLFAALTHWVEDGVAPDQVIATRYVDNAPAKGVALQRPLCAFPEKAWYKGTGDTNRADSFICAVAKPGGVSVSAN